MEAPLILRRWAFAPKGENAQRFPLKIFLKYKKPLDQTG